MKYLKNLLYKQNASVKNIYITQLMMIMKLKADFNFFIQMFYLLLTIIFNLTW